MRRPYPLQWPADWKRTRYPENQRAFISNFTQDRDAVLRRLQRRGAANVVITSNLPVGNKGLPYLGSFDADAGIAVYWFQKRSGEERATERVLACDKWRRPEDNLRAIMKTLEALDGIERWGCSQVVDRAIGFHALPPGSSGTIDSAPVRRPWREVLGGAWPELDAAELLAIAKARHRKLIVEAHPDKGGDPARAAELNAALAEAETELTR
jgi:hypothetical protein